MRATAVAGRQGVARVSRRSWLVDDHGRVAGLDACTPPATGPPSTIEQGGLATQHADAVAAAIAVAAGAPVEAEPFRHGAAGRNGEPDVASHALWWPTSKISGRYLAPVLFGHDELDAIEQIEEGHLSRRAPPRSAGPGRSSVTLADPE